MRHGGVPPARESRRGPRGRGESGYESSMHAPHVIPRWSRISGPAAKGYSEPASLVSLVSPAVAVAFGESRESSTHAPRVIPIPRSRRSRAGDDGSRPGAGNARFRGRLPTPSPRWRMQSEVWGGDVHETLTRRREMLTRRFQSSNHPRAGVTRTGAASRGGGWGQSSRPAGIERTPAALQPQDHVTLAEHPLPMGRSTLISAVTAVCGLRGSRQLAGPRPGLAIRAIESGLEP